MGCGWFECEGVLVEDNPDLEAFSQEEGKSAFMLKRIELWWRMSEVLCWSAARKEEGLQLQGGIYLQFRSGSQELRSWKFQFFTSQGAPNSYQCNWNPRCFQCYSSSWGCVSWQPYLLPEVHTPEMYSVWPLQPDGCTALMKCVVVASKHPHPVYAADLVVRGLHELLEAGWSQEPSRRSWRRKRIGTSHRPSAASGHAPHLCTKN